LLTTLAEQLSEFYRTVPRADVAPDEYVALFEREQVENRKVLTDSLFPFDQDWLDSVLSGFDSALADNRGSLEDRVRHGRVVEGHGDLRPEHVCLVDPPVVIDCLEFSQRLRFVDPFDELSYLGMECRTIGAPWIKDFLIGKIASGLDDQPADNVLLFYEAYRAFLRARQSLAHLLVPSPRKPAKWMPKARRYLEIAERAVITLAT
jgi:aminoglycoside phosphotransferase family enzyme